MKFSKKELILKIARAHEVANRCVAKYGGNKYPYLVGAYEAVFCDLLGIREFDEVLRKVGEK